MLGCLRAWLAPSPGVAPALASSAPSMRHRAGRALASEQRATAEDGASESACRMRGGHPIATTGGAAISRGLRLLPWSGPFGRPCDAAMVAIAIEPAVRELTAGRRDRPSSVARHVTSNHAHQRRSDRARAARRRRTEDGRELPQARRRRLLRRAHLPPRDHRLHDPGRLPGGDRHRRSRLHSSRTSSTSTRSSAARSRWRTPGRTRTARSSSSSPSTPPHGSTASTRSSAASPAAWTPSTRSRRTETGAGDRPVEPQVIERIELSE